LTDIDSDEVDRLDREIVGFSRRVDHQAWQSWDRRAFALRDATGRLSGYGYAQPAGRLGPIVALDPPYLLPLIGALMDAVPVADGWQIHVPGVAARPFATLLGAGLRFDGPPIIYCATELTIDHERYVPATFALP
jgi:hypothetical protein